MIHARLSVLATFGAHVLIVGLTACGVPTSDSTFEAIDGDVLGGLNDPTTTTTTTTPPAAIDLPASIPDSTTTVPTTEPAPPLAAVAIYFISRGSLTPITLELDPQFTFDQLIVLLEQGPPTGSVGSGLESFVAPGLIVGTPTEDGGVINVELNGAVFDEIGQRDQQKALAQIVVTFLENTTAVGQVAFTRDGEELLVPADGGSKATAAVSDFASLNPQVPRTAIEPPVDPVPTTTIATATTTA